MINSLYVQDRYNITRQDVFQEQIIIIFFYVLTEMYNSYKFFLN